VKADASGNMGLFSRKEEEGGCISIWVSILVERAAAAASFLLKLASVLLRHHQIAGIS
jgi:hypothetical protein